MKADARPGWLLRALGAALPALLLRLPHRVPRVLRLLLLLLLLLGPLLVPRLGSPTMAPDSLAGDSPAAQAPPTLFSLQALSHSHSYAKGALGQAALRQSIEGYSLVPEGSILEAAVDLDDQVLLLVRQPHRDAQLTSSSGSPGSAGAAAAALHHSSAGGVLRGWCVFGEGSQQQLASILGAAPAPTPGWAYLRCALPKSGLNGSILPDASIALSLVLPRHPSSTGHSGRAGQESCSCLCCSQFLTMGGRKAERQKGRGGEEECGPRILQVPLGALPDASGVGFGHDHTDGRRGLQQSREPMSTLLSCASLTPLNATGQRQQWPRFVYDSVLQSAGLYLFVKGLRRMESRGRHSFARSSVPDPAPQQNVRGRGPAGQPLHRRKLSKTSRGSTAASRKRGGNSGSTRARSSSGGLQLGSPEQARAEQGALNVTCVYGDCWEAPAIDGALELVLCPLPPVLSPCWALLNACTGKPCRAGAEGGRCSAECGVPVTVRTKEGELVPSLASFTGEPVFPMHWRLDSRALKSNARRELGERKQGELAGRVISEEQESVQSEVLSETDGMAARKEGGEGQGRWGAGGAKQHHVCACTMVYDVAKFLPEWLLYHSWMGVERFFLYDNNSDDNTTQVATTLARHLQHYAGSWRGLPGSGSVQDGVNVTVHAWPWLKSQQAGFSHCLLRAAPVCTWVLFADVDEFVRPRFLADLHSHADVAALMSQQGPLLHYLMRQVHNSVRVALESSDLKLGQLCLQCYEFGPSGHRHHPGEGVTVGYTCRRRRAFRHKCMVLPEAVHESLYTRVHDFELSPGWVSNTDLKQGKERLGWLNHYKYQAWAEFKAKFRRRVATQVHDWTAQGAREAEERARRKGFGAARATKDREPILSTADVEPPDWVNQFCERNDTDLRDFVLMAFQRRMDGHETSGTKILWQTD